MAALAQRLAASASGKAPVAVPGSLRLLLELGLVAGAAWALQAAGAILPAASLGGLVILRYAASYDLVRWLLKQ